MPACVRHFWLRLLAVTALLYTLMAGAAELLHSYRGEAGLIIAALVLAAALTADRLLFSGALLRSLRELGLHAPARRGLLAAAVISAALIASLPLAARASGATLSLRADWLWLIPGLLAQAGLAEELVFRGFVFGRIRATRAFWRAVLLSIGPFALVHMALFFSMPPAIAAASLMLSIVMCAPLAQLYELGGRTIWPAALVHATVQGAIKLVDIEGGQLLPLIWIGACAILPWAVFLWRRAEP